MKISLNRTKCIGCGTCFALCPNVFLMRDDGKSSLKKAKIADIQEVVLPDVNCCLEAAEACPVQCVSIAK